MEEKSFLATKCPYCEEETLHKAKNFQTEGKTKCPRCGNVYSNRDAEKIPKGWFEAFCKALDEDNPVRLEEELEEHVD